MAEDTNAAEAVEIAGICTEVGAAAMKLSAVLEIGSFNLTGATISTEVDTVTSQKRRLQLPAAVVAEEGVAAADEFIAGMLILAIVQVFPPSKVSMVPVTPVPIPVSFVSLQVEMKVRSKLTQSINERLISSLKDDSRVDICLLCDSTRACNTSWSVLTFKCSPPSKHGSRSLVEG